MRNSEESGMVKPDRLHAIKEEANELLAMTVASVRTARFNQ